jgi:hypothetical protein
LEVVLLVPVLMLLALFVLWAGRGGRAALVTDLAAEEAATAAALACEEGKPGCEDLVTDVLRARPGLDFLCIGGPRPAAGETTILEQTWLGRDDLPDPDPADPDPLTAQNTEVSGVGVLGVSFLCETDGAVAPLRGVFPTVAFRGQASEVAVLQGAPKAGVNDAEVTEGSPGDAGDPPKLEFMLTLDAPATAEVVLPYTITGGDPADGRATEVDDYTLPSPLSVTIPQGATQATIEVPVVPDGLHEANETLLLELGDPPDPALLNLDQARRSATGTIRDDDEPPYVYARDATMQVTEGDGGQLIFQVGLLTASGVEATVEYSTADGTAEVLNTCGGRIYPDYTARTGALTFGPGQTGPQEVEVTIEDDLCGEGPETVELRLRVGGLVDASGARFSGARFSGTVGPDTACTAVADAGTDGDDCAVGTILDDEPGLSVNDARACENPDPAECGMNPGDPAGMLVFTVTRSGPKTPAVRVRVGTADDDAAVADVADSIADYMSLGDCSTSSTTFVDIPAGTATTTGTVEVVLVDDMLDEDDETLLLHLCDPPDNAWIDISPARGTIVDDDAPPTVLVSDASAPEGDGALSFAVSLDAPSGRTQGVTVGYCTSGGTAVAPDDYTAVACGPPRQGQVRFGPGETGPKPVPVDVVDDDLNEDDETVVLRLDASNARFADYVGPTDPCSAAVPDDPATTNIDESANNDDDCAVGAIEDDDSPPLLRVRNATAVEGGPLEFEVSLVSAADPSTQVAAAKPITVDYLVNHVTTDNADFEGGRSGRESFDAGERTQTVTVQSRHDVLDENDETFELQLTVPGEDPAAAVDDATPGTGTIEDDDDPPVARIVEAGGFGASATEGLPLSFTAQLDRASGREVELRWRTVQKATVSLPYAAATGAAAATVPGADYVNVTNGTATVPVGASRATLTVRSVDDGRAPHDPLDERDELFEVRLDDPPGPDPTYSLGDPDRADGRIVDDDEHELRILDTCRDPRFPDYEVCVDEGDGEAEFTVGLFIAGTGTPLQANRAVTAPYTTRERPSEGERAAAAGSDFTAAAPGSRLTIPAGQDRTTVSVAVADDDSYEHDETFVLRLGAPDYGSLAADRTAVAVIIDDDDEPRLTVADAVAAEGEKLEFVLSLSPEAGRTVSVGYRTVAEAAATGGAACGGSVPLPDFESAPAATATFAPGADTFTVAVETCDDSFDEDDPVDGDGNPHPDDDETLTLRLSSHDGIAAPPTGASPCPAQAPLGSGHAGDDCAVGRIADDDPAPALSLEGPAAAVPETATARFTARLDNPSGRVVRAQVAFGDDSDTATGGAECGADPAPDYVTAAGAWIEFDPADAVSDVETFEVEICGDGIDEDRETFTVRLDPDSVQNATLGAGLAQAEIADIDDPPLVRVVEDGFGVGAYADEGDDLEFTVRLSAPSAKVVTVDARTFSGTPALTAVPHDDVPTGDHADYTAVDSLRLTFNPGDPTEQTVQVATLTDDEIERDERLQLRLSAPDDPDIDTNAHIADPISLGVIRAQCLAITDDNPAPTMYVARGFPGYERAEEIPDVEEGAEVFLNFIMDPAVCSPGIPTSARLRAGCAPLRDDWLRAACESVDLPSLPTVSQEDFPQHSGTRGVSSSGFIRTSRITKYRPIDDNLDEPDEYYRVLVSIEADASSAPASWRGRLLGLAEGVITDNDTSEVSVGPASAAEGDDTGGRLEFPLTLSVPNSRAVTVTYRPVAVATAGAATGAPSCAGAADFVIPAAAATATIAAGDTTGTASVALCGDTDPEDDETLQLRLVSAATVAETDNPSVALPAPVRAAVGTITDDDAACVDPGDGDDPAPVLAVADRRAPESAGTMTFTVGIDRPVCEGVSLAVGYRTVDGTAESGSDYRAVSGAATLAANSQSLDLAVAVIDDDDFESDETFTLEVGWGSSLPARYRSAAAVSATGTIDNDDAVFVQASDAGPVDEGEDLEFTVSLVDAGGSPSSSGEPVSVQYHTRDLTATGRDARTDPDADYRRVPAASPGELDFAAGETSKTVTVATFTDSRDEGDEHLQLRLVNPSANARLRNRIATGTIGSGCVDPGDPSIGRPAVSFTPLSVGEDAGVAPFELTADCATAGATWRLEFSGLTAVVEPLSTDVGRSHTFADETADVAVADRLETFAAGAPASIAGRMAVNDDDGHELDERLRVRATWVGDLPSHWGSRHWDFTVTVVDDDDPKVTVSNDVQVDEGAGSASVTVELDAPATEPVDVAYTTVAQPAADHPATAGGDYTHTADRVEIAAGADRATISVPVLDDSDVEDDETFLVRLSDPSDGLRLGVDTAAEVTIVDNDRCIDPAVGDPPGWRAATGFPANHRYSQYGAAEEGDPIIFGVELDQPLCEGVQYKVGALVEIGGGRTEVQWADLLFADDDPVGTASAEDFHSGHGWGYGYYIFPLTTVHTFVFNTFEDAEIEEDETFVVSVWWCRPTEVVCHLNTNVRSDWHDAELRMTGTIIDDDDPEVTVANVAAAEAAEDAGEMVFVMNLDPPPKQVATVRYVTSATPSAGRGAAARGLDYTHTEGELDIPVGSGRARISVPIVDDDLEELDETFLLRLRAVRGLRMADPSAQGTILDDDTPLPALSASAPDGVFEGDRVTVVVTLAEESSRVVTVAYRTESGTAAAGSDYVHTADTLTFQPGETSKAVTVDTVDDSVGESAEETFGLRLANAANARVGPDDRVTSITVYDDENPPPVTVSVADASAAEGDPLEFAVRLDKPSLQPVTLPYSTVDGTATAGEDYTAAASRRLTVAARSLSATISVPTARDADAEEGDETMRLSFGTATNATAPTSAPTGTIRDGPAIGTPLISLSDAAGVREGGRLAFEVTLDPAPRSAVTVQYRTLDGTAVAPGDYNAARSTLVIAAGDTTETVEVQTIDDGVNEVDETLRLELVRVVSGDAAIVDGSGEGTIIGEKAVISVHDAVVDEEDDSSTDPEVLGGHVEVRLDRALEIDLEVNLRFDSDTAIWGYRGSGHNPFSDFFYRVCAVAAGTTLLRCEIVTYDDSRYEGDETASIVLSLGSGYIVCFLQGLDWSDCPDPADHAVLGDATATLTINEDEAPPQIQASDRTVGEVGTLTLEASLAGPVSERTVVVDWATEAASGASAATAGTICSAGADYVSGSGTLTYEPADDANPRGTRSQRILVRICPDAVREGDEVFHVRLSRPNHATLRGDTDNDGEVLIRITIEDND